MKVLMVDDGVRITKQMDFVLRQKGFSVALAHSASECLEKISENPTIGIIIIDVQLPDVSGINLIQQIKSLIPQAEIIVLTAFGNIKDGVEAMKAGAFDYVTKTDGLETLLLVIERANEKHSLQAQLNELKKQVISNDKFDKIIGVSTKLVTAIELAKKVAPTEITVLLLGETGTGKELFAEAIHSASPRNKYPFVAINCSAIPPDLLESELFGYKKGAFTGAVQDKIGLFAKAHNGTLFLDEIGEMPIGLQSKLLRVLETHTFTPLGGIQPESFNTRIIAATNRSMEQEIFFNRFRSDLYYRLEGFVIVLPPLRERKGDIEMLAHYYISLFNHKYQKSIDGMDEQFTSYILNNDWKGNVRELKNVIERCVVLAEGKKIMIPDQVITSYPAKEQNYRESQEKKLPLKSEIQPPQDTKKSAGELTVPELLQEKHRIMVALQHVQGNRRKAAELLGISLATLYRKILKYQL